MATASVTKESLAFHAGPDRGYSANAWYLKDAGGDALIEVLLGDAVVRSFLFPAYKIWNIAAHLSDIVDSELDGNDSGYRMAAWNGIGPM